MSTKSPDEPGPEGWKGIRSALAVAVFKGACAIDLNKRERPLAPSFTELFNRGVSKIVEKPRSFEEAVLKVMAEQYRIMISKQKDYGPRNILDSGEIGVIIRMNDKIARLRNLYGITDRTYRKKAAGNESIEDSLIDVANYAIICLMLIRKEFELPLE